MRANNRWYKLKRQAKFRSRIDNTKDSIVYDYPRNHQVPNITTNDVYYSYKRQMSVYIFNIPVLSSVNSIFYIYPETIGNKGSDEVCTVNWGEDNHQGEDEQKIGNR